MPRSDEPSKKPENEEVQSAKHGKHRSPNYPLFDLKKAVEKTKVLYDADKTHKVPILIVHERLGYKTGSSAGNQAVGALKSYGLVTVEGEGDKRQIAVSDIGRKVVLGAGDTPALLKVAAVGPALFKSLWDKYSATGLPKDDVLRHHLIFDRSFNEDFVDNAVARFRATIQYAKLDSSDKLGEDEGEDEELASDGEGEGAEMQALEEPKQKQKPATLPAVSVGLKDFPLYTAGQKGALYVPSEMTEADFVLLKQQLDAYMLVIKATSVRDN